MTFKQTDYDRCLPYGYRYDEETGTEYLFDRGYTPIASRNAEGPMVVVASLAPDLPASKPSDYQVYFYTSGFLASPGTRRVPQCERILSRFIRNRPIDTAFQFAV